MTAPLRLTALAATLSVAVVAAYAPAAPVSVLPAVLPAVLPDSTWQWPEHAQNLQVLPDSTGPAKLQRVMQSFTRALGVRCSECHVGSGPDFNTWDFASDEKPHKNVARGMMRMTMALNTTGVPEALGPHHHGGNAAEHGPGHDETHRHADGAEHAHDVPEHAHEAMEHHEAEPEMVVTCWTCHRGAKHPETLAPPTTDAH